MACGSKAVAIYPAGFIRDRPKRKDTYDVRPRTVSHDQADPLFSSLVLYSIALLPFEPSFLGPLLDFLFPPDQHLFEIYLMLSTPIAFLINLLPMLRKSNFEQTRPFHTARSHTVTGFSILIVLLIIFSPLVFDYLDGIVPRSIQVLYLLALLPLPTAFLLGRLPRSIKVDSKSTLVFRPTPINLLIGVALLLVILMELSSFVLERFACSYWGSC